MLKFFVAFMSFGSLVLGFIVLSRNPRNNLNRHFAVMAFFNSLWAIANLLTAFSPIDVYVRAQYATGALLLGSGLEWLFYLIGRKANWLRFLLIYSISSFLAFTSLFGNLIIARIDVVRFGSFEGEFGPLFYFYTFFIVVSLLFIDFKLFFEAFRSRGVRRQQMMYVAFGALIFTFFSTLPSFVLPLIGITDLSQFDVTGSFLYLSLISYSIVKYRLMS
ncbi:MAG: histidine kinase N-terminal 7TM domain-containing protein, partial [Patescibacteria group bacterium]